MVISQAERESSVVSGTGYGVEDSVELEGGGEPTQSYGYCYYRRPDGWISSGLADRSTQDAYRAKGMESLLQYGRFYLHPPLRQDAYKQTIPQWQPSELPFNQILLAPGGPEEFPLDQIHQLGWHLGCRAIEYEYFSDGRWRRHLRKVTFPQLRGVNLVDHTCKVCEKRFVSERVLGEHIRVAHPEQGSLLHMAETQKQLAAAVSGLGSAPVSDDQIKNTIAFLTKQVEAQQEALAHLQASRGTSLQASAGGEKQKKPLSEKQKAHLRRLHDRRANTQLAQEVNDARNENP